MGEVRFVTVVGASRSRKSSFGLAHQTLIGMSPSDLRRAIELSAAATGLLLQPGLVDTVLEDLAGEPARWHCSPTRCLRHVSAGGG